MAMEDDLTSAVKSEDDLASQKHKDEETPENLKDEETQENLEDEETVDDVEYFLPAIHISTEEGWVDELREMDDPKKDPVPYVHDEEDEIGVNFTDEEERKNFRLYFEEYAASEGFDIEHYSNKVLDGLLPLDLSEEEEKKYTCTRDCKKSVEAAIEYKNRMNNWELKLERIIKCNYVIGSFYYVTFDAIDNATKTTRTYQAQLAREHFTPKTTIFMFRVKPDSSPEPKQ